MNGQPKCQEAFDRLKKALLTSPILAYPRAGCEFIVDTDASAVGSRGCTFPGTGW
uniref:Retrovirus-related pol polyprotein from transposon n=1 Tax=Triatoma infestans TaxID=30076 RepID=A0A170VC02_TRIIF